MQILVVEDNESLAKGIGYRFEDAGHAVDLIDDGFDADTLLRDSPADLVILDINLPGLDGLEVLQRMRARGDERPVILLTARSETADRIRGLDMGADDYLVKPFEMAELEARARAVLRRRSNPLRDTLSLGPLTLDLGARQAELAGEPLPMPRREVAVLEALLSAEGRFVSKGTLLDRTYGTGAAVEETAVEVHVSRLRKRLREAGLSIESQRGIGYRLVEST